MRRYEFHVEQKGAHPACEVKESTLLLRIFMQPHSIRVKLRDQPI
jgi:hypothetical protein